MYRSFMCYRNLEIFRRACISAKYLSSVSIKILHCNPTKLHTTITMSSHRPPGMRFGNRQLSVDQPLLQPSERSPGIAGEEGDTTPNPPNENQLSVLLLNHLRHTAEDFEKTQNDDSSVLGEDGEVEAESPNARDDEYKKISELFVECNMLIYHLLSALDQRTAKAEAMQETQSGAFELLQKVSEKLDIFDTNIAEEGCSFETLLELMFDIKPATEGHFKTLLDNMKQLHCLQVKKQDLLMEKLDNIHEEQSELPAKIRYLDDVLADLQIVVMERFDGIQDDQDRQGDRLGEKVDNVYRAHYMQREVLVNKLEQIHQDQEAQEDILIERLEEIQEEREAQGEMLTEKLDHIHEFQHFQQDTLVDKFEEIHDEQLESQNTLMEKLNEISKQQLDMDASQSKWSVLVYGAEERILGRLATMEEKIDTMVLDNAKVSEQGNEAEERGSAQLQDGNVAAVPQENNTEKETVTSANAATPQRTKLQAADGADSKSGEDRVGTLRALFGVLGPLFLVSLMLAGLPGAY